MSKKKKEKQLDFNLHNAPKNIYYKYKEQYELWLAGLETKKYIKDPLTWFTIITSVSLIATQLYIVETREKVPEKVPIFNYYLNPAKRLVPDEYIYLLPFLSLSVLIATILLSNSYYHRERELSKILGIVSLLTNISICLIFIKLFLTI